MKLPKINPTVGWLLFAVVSTLYISTITGKVKKTEKMIRNEVELERLQEEVPTIRAEREQYRYKYDSAVASHDLILQELETRKTPIKNAIKTIPVIVGSFDKDQLRYVISEYHKRYGLHPNE